MLSFPTDIKYISVIDTGLLITLICVLGGGFIIILNEINKKKKWKNYQLGLKLLLLSFASLLHLNSVMYLLIGF